MTGFALLGALVIAAIVAAGFYWVATNVSFKRQPERYTYEKDENGNERVRDHTDETS
jgi:hypothetical protein